MEKFEDTVFRDVKPSTLLQIQRRCEDVNVLHLHTFTLNMEEIRASEKSAHFHRII